jgi:hypothetical protein
VTATSLKPALAKPMSSPAIPSTKGDFATADDAEIARPPANAPSKDGAITPTTSQEREATAVVTGVPGATSRDGRVHAFHHGMRQALRAVVDTEIMVSDSVVAALGAASLLVKNMDFVHDPGGTRHTEQALQSDLSKTAWYWLAWIGGAVFTSILAPLLVDLIKLRIGTPRLPPDSNGQAQLEGTEVARGNQPRTGPVPGGRRRR